LLSIHALVLQGDLDAVRTCLLSHLIAGQSWRHAVM